MTSKQRCNIAVVRNDGSRIEGRLGSLDDLYIPANVNSAHWNFIRVVITDKTIQLYDLQGVDAKTKKYSQATENYCSFGVN